MSDLHPPFVAAFDQYQAAVRDTGGPTIRSSYRTQMSVAVRWIAQWLSRGGSLN
ncbi:MAG TPA: hypothetical protein VGB14_00400 [Acidimicrobiales bacterium]